MSEVMNIKDFRERIKSNLNRLNTTEYIKIADKDNLVEWIENDIDSIQLNIDILNYQVEDTRELLAQKLTY